MAQTYDRIAKLNELIKGIEFATLTTIRSDGSLHSCPMTTAEVHDDGALWFFSSNMSEKVEAIRNNRHVNLAYADAGSQRYVSISGSADPVRDHIMAAQLWSSLYEKWFPKGLQDPDLILLRIQVRAVEYWSSPTGRMVPLPGFAEEP